MNELTERCEAGWAIAKARLELIEKQSAIIDELLCRQGDPVVESEVDLLATALLGTHLGFATQSPATLPMLIQRWALVDSMAKELWRDQAAALVVLLKGLRKQELQALQQPCSTATSLCCSGEGSEKLGSTPDPFL